MSENPKAPLIYPNPLFPITDDKNRVILDIDAEGSDYINASFIDVS